mmetsp:Transcript_13814/g.41750  ORF Transcript_13814/g.41750 Transcript_13814/m.41750 type:complete len:248 (-) Transcript_13814:1808-2551(-)
MDAVCLIVGCTWHGIIIVLSLLVLLLLQLLLPAQLDQRSQLGQVEHLKIPAGLRSVQLGDILPEAEDPGHVHEALCIKLPGVRFLYALQAALGDGIPIGVILLTLLEEVCQLVRARVLMVWVDRKTRFAVHNDFCWSTMHRGEGGDAAAHGLNHRQTESLVECRLHEDTMGVGNFAVQLAVLDAVLLRGEPPEATVHQVVLLDQSVHLLALVLLLPVSGLGRVDGASTHHYQVGQLAEAVRLGEQLH